MIQQKTEAEEVNHQYKHAENKSVQARGKQNKTKIDM